MALKVAMHNWMRPEPIESETRCSAISWRASFHARVLSYLAILPIYAGTPSAVISHPEVLLKRESANASAGRGEDRVRDGRSDHG